MLRSPARRGRVRRDDGALAVLTAVLAVVLFGIAALAVEFTDFYARDRASQTVADTAALSAAQMLPEACAAAERAIDVLVEDGNAVRNDSGNASYGRRANGTAIPRPQLRTQLSDRDVTNGEVQLLTSLDPANPPTSASATWLNTGGCGPTGGATTARVVRVITPPREIDLDFASAVTGGDEKGLARAVASAEIRSPGLGDTLPVFLPASCNFGANYVITDSPSASSPPSSAPRYDPRGANGGRQAPVITSVTSSLVSGGLVQQVTISVSNLKVAPTTASIKFDFHTGSGGSTVRWPTSSPTGVTALSVVPGPAPTPPITAATTYTAQYQVQLNNFITSRGGIWFVRASELTGTNAGEWTKDGDAKSFDVVAVAAPGCGDPSTGNFGLLRGDRDDGNTNSQQLALNFINGLDFTVETIPTLPTVNTACQANGSPATAVLSTENPPSDGANCLAIESGGNRGPITSGLIEGASGEDGRLKVQATLPPSTCVEPAGPGDAATTGNVPGNRQWRTPGNPRVSIWNTQLSCYLPSGTPLSALQTCDGCLDSAIVTDPRYFLVPVLNTSDRPPSSRQWPVKEFRGAFITNEVSGAAATCATDLKCNGLEFNTGGQSLFALQVFVFPLSALPDEVPVDGGDGTTYTGVGPKDFRLVE